jgi:hypothetical protein
MTFNGNDAGSTASVWGNPPNPLEGRLALVETEIKKKADFKETVQLLDDKASKNF